MSKSSSKSVLAETKSAVNKAMYNCTKAKKATALKFLKQLTAEVEALKEIVPEKKKATAKPKFKDSKGKSVTWAKLTKADLIAMLEADKK